jgi:hypothetical protein
MIPLNRLLVYARFRPNPWKQMAIRAVRLEQESQLISARAMLDLATAWRVAMERPEVDLRDDVDAMIETLSDQIAVMEEHAS